MSARPETMPENDVVDLLVRQHEEIRHLFTEVRNINTAERAEAFDRLRRFLAVHETAEELIVHPHARQVVPDGDRVVAARLAEENEAKKILREMERMGPHANDFMTKLTELKQAVLEHAEHEERDEFPYLKAAHSDARLKAMGLAVKAVEALAPTHPHPGVESVKANVIVGPYAAMLDRSRDLLTQALRRFTSS